MFSEIFYGSAGSDTENHGAGRACPGGWGLLIAALSVAVAVVGVGTQILLQVVGGNLLSNERGFQGPSVAHADPTWTQQCFRRHETDPHSFTPSGILTN